jgi:hypothetical protein
LTVEVEEICRKLKPIIGDRADRYWLAYLSEDYRSRQELETALQILAVKYLGADVEDPKVHLSAPRRDAAAGEYPLGSVVYCDTRLACGRTSGFSTWPFLVVLARARLILFLLSSRIF